MTGPLEWDDDLVTEALTEHHASEEHFGDLSYIRFRRDFHHISRGTAIVRGRAVPAYPSIGRIFVLKEGLERNFPDRFAVEEKIDGYHTRIVRVDGELLPLTRGGLICPFTHDRLRDLLDPGTLFQDHPDLVLCGEMAGPGNPYIDAAPPRATEDVRYLVFDCMHLDENGYLPLEERDALFESHDLVRAPLFGWYRASDADELRDLVRRLHEEGSEGLVFKPPAEGLRVKYVTPRINLVDIMTDASLLAELPGEFFLSRILRLVLSLEEMDLVDEIPEMEQELGHALMTDFLETLREVRDRGGVVSKVFRIRVHEEKTIDRLLRHMNHVSNKIQVKERGERKRGDDGYVHTRLEKIFQQSTSYLKSILKGDYVID